MIQTLISKLNAAPFGHVSPNPMSGLKLVEKELRLTAPEELRQLLLKFGAAITFANGAKFRPSEQTGLEDKDGYHRLAILYGVAPDSNGILERNAIYRPQLPHGLVVVGEALGSNQICLEIASGRVMFWHHEAVSDETSVFEIANSFARFLVLLESDDEADMSQTGVSKRESFLDF